MATTKHLDLSPFGKVARREDTLKGRFRVRINYPQPIGRRDSSFATVEEANAYLLEEYQRHGAGQSRRRAPATIADLAESWYARRERKGRERKTLAADRAYLDARILPRWGAWLVSQVTVLDVQDWIDELEADGLSEGMVRKYRGALDGVLREGIRQAMITESPAAADLIDITINRAMPSRGRQVFTDDELAALWDVIDVRYRALIPLAACGAGLRIGEWAGLAVTDFDPRTNNLSVRRKVVEVSGRLYVEDWLKGRNPGRVIRLGDELAGIWTAHVARFSRGGWVFPAPGGGPLHPNNFRRRVWRPAVAAIGRPEAKFHWLRHSNVSKLREEGIDLEAASKHVGHSSVTITDRVYAHQTESINEEIAEAGDRLLARLGLGSSGAEVGQTPASGIRKAR